MLLFFFLQLSHGLSLSPGKEPLNRPSVGGAGAANAYPGGGATSRFVLASGEYEEFLCRRLPELHEVLETFLQDLEKLRFHLLACEAALQESLEESTDILEASVDTTVKYLLDRANEFFRNLEEAEKDFGTSLTEIVTMELEGFATSQLEETNELRAKILSNK